MEFKNLLQLKDGTYRIGFDVTEDDYRDRVIGIFGSKTYKTLNIGNDIVTSLKVEKHLDSLGYDNKVVSIKDVKLGSFSGFIYFTMKSREEWFQGIKDKYNII